MKYLKKFARQKIKVMGITVEVPILGEGAELPIGENISDEMDRVSAQLAYWGAVLAEAKKEQIKVDTWYRRYRAQMTVMILDKGGSITEWKVKARIEASDGFVKHKDAIAQAQKHVSLLEGIVKAFDKKGNQLQSKGARMRQEISKQGMTTKKKPRGWDLSGKGSDDDDDLVVRGAEISDSDIQAAVDIATKVAKKNKKLSKDSKSLKKKKIKTATKAKKRRKE